MLLSTLPPFRHALLTALGLATLACGPKNGASDDDSSSAGSEVSDTSASTGPTGGATDPGTTDAPTTDALTTEATSPTTEATSPTTGGPPAACDGVVTDVLQAHEPGLSGFQRCDGGLAHRVEAIACAVPIAPTDCTDNSGGGGCSVNDDCTEQPFGQCRQDFIGGGILIGGTCSCNYGCAQDSDCPDGEMCRCALEEGLGSASACIPTDCKVDADCGDGLCAIAVGVCADGAYAAHCTTPNDECKSDADCDGLPCNWLDFDQPNAWGCNDSVCGRPYLVDDVAVLAPVAGRDDWRAALTPALPPARQRLADAWTELARMEHASVAAFAGFTLQLLAVGAPPELLHDAQAALADELVHARLGFGLASAYAGRGVGPGPLPIAAPPTADLAELLVAVVREACVCETLSALEAREAAEQAADPVVRGVWTRIAADEQRHAEPGWRVVQWILQVAPELTVRARDSFTAAVAEARRGAARDALAPADLELRRHGVVDASLRAAVWRRGLAELIDPCAAALCAAA